MSDYKCTSCDEPCEAIYVDMGFQYAGTHCTGGAAGRHVHMTWVSDCCLSGYEEIEDEDE